MGFLCRATMPRSARLLSVCLVVILAQYSLSVASAQSLTEEQQAVHVLNRLGFGPRLGDIEKVKAMGIEAYIEQQLPRSAFRTRSLKRSWPPSTR